MAIGDRGRSAGRRQCLITLKTRPATDAVDESYTPVDGPWTELAKVWAQKVELGGDEQFRAMQLSAKYDTRWLIRYRSDMDPDLVDVAKVRQVIHKSRTHDIVSAVRSDRQDDIELKTLSKAG